MGGVENKGAGALSWLLGCKGWCVLSGVLADEGRGSREVLRGMGLNVGMRSRKPRRATLKQFQIASQWQAKGIHSRGEKFSCQTVGLKIGRGVKEQLGSVSS